MSGPTTGRSHPLLAGATRIGRLSDNDIVLDDANVSRHHAVIIDTGTSYVITDLRSANGVDVGGERIRGTATLADGDRVRICDHEFVFEMRTPPPLVTGGFSPHTLTATTRVASWRATQVPTFAVVRGGGT